VGNRHPLSAPFGVFAAADGPYVLARGAHASILQLQLSQVVGASRVGERIRGSSPMTVASTMRRTSEPGSRPGRVSSRSRPFARRSVAGVPAAPVSTLADALNSEQAAVRGVLDGGGGSSAAGLRLPTQPVKFTGSAPNVAARAPALGEHSEAVVAEWLGLSAERIAELAAGLFGAQETRA
jgi:CoA:oxalate CoA-transferase